MENIREGNKLIAEFLGAMHYDAGGNIWYYEGPDGFQHESGDFLKYNTDWNWLMSAVEKIEKMDFTVHIGSFSFCTISKFENDEDPWQGIHISTEVDPIYGKVESKIHGVWLAVVQFIKLLNQGEGSQRSVAR